MSKCDLDRLEDLARDVDVENLHDACDEIRALRAEVDRLNPVFKLAQRWCNRPHSVTHEWLRNDADLFAELRRRVEHAEDLRPGAAKP